MNTSKKIEAIQWLTKANDPCPLACNRFDGKNDAIGFVKRLYANGAKKIYIAGFHDEYPKVFHADTLLVILPEEKGKREAVEKIYVEEFLGGHGGGIEIEVTPEEEHMIFTGDGEGFSSSYNNRLKDKIHRIFIEEEEVEFWWD